MYSTTMAPQLNHGAQTMWTNQRQAGPRFLLWVDGVGGYLVCLADEVVIGQAIPHGGADVPIQGDLSRLHATIRHREKAICSSRTPKHASTGGESRRTVLCRMVMRSRWEPVF